jgi:CHASE3 domain sensor protein
MRMTVGRKLTALTALAVLGLVVTSVTLGLTLNSLGASFNDLADTAQPSVRAALELRLAKTAQGDDLGSYLASRDASPRRRAS